MTARFISFAAVAALLGCGSGTIRPSDDTGGVEPAPSVAPSPPVADPDPAPVPSPAPEAPEAGGAPSSASPRDSGTAGQAEPGTAVEIRRIGRWVSSGIRGARRLVIRDPATWAHFWSELGAGVRPDVDFQNDLVIAVAAGERSSGGHDIEVRQVERAGGQLRIEVLETYPSTGCVTTSAMTQPVDVVMVSAAGVTGWSFIDRRAVGTC
ncbi:MAG TPA: protease complex subunit PrcB family protein [Gemmatimonadales bacterium]